MEQKVNALFVVTLIGVSDGNGPKECNQEIEMLITLAWIGKMFSKLSKTHVKVSQLVNKMCSQQGKLVKMQVVTMLLFFQVATRLSLSTC
jgi:hypothetical protein